MKTTPKKNGGFTLVELIVVIAILAILAAVAIPAYSGYIEKAEKAGDLQLLGAVNEAFAAACVAGGEDVYTIKGASIDVGKDGSIGDVSIYDEEFDMFFAGNEGSTFKVIKSLLFDMEKRVFVDPMSVASVAVALPGGGTLNITGAQAETFNKSTYSDIGGTALSAQVDSVADLAAKMILAGFENPDNASTNTFFSMVNTEEYLTSIGMTEEKMTELLGENGDNFAAVSDYLANTLVTTAAGATKNMTSATVTENLSKNPQTYISDVKTRLNNAETAGEALAEAAVIYGVYTSYVNTYYSEEDAAKKLSAVDGSTSLIAAMDEMQTSDKWSEYMAGQGKNDVDAYLEAMKVINDATTGENSATAGHVYDNGFGGDIQDLLNGLLGA